METPIKVNRRGVTVETADLCVACKCRSKPGNRYVIIDCNGRRGVACQIIENFYGIKFAICETNYGTHLCKTCRKLFDRYDAIVKSLEHLKHKLYNDAQKFATVRVVNGKRNHHWHCHWPVIERLRVVDRLRGIAMHHRHRLLKLHQMQQQNHATSLTPMAVTLNVQLLSQTLQTL